MILVLTWLGHWPSQGKGNSLHTANAMRAGSSPWSEAWPVKVLAVALAAGVIYVGETRYERGIKRDELLRAKSAEEDPSSLRFDLLEKIDLAGVSRAEMAEMVNESGKGIHLSRNLGEAEYDRGLIALSRSSGSYDWSGHCTFEISGGVGASINLEPRMGSPDEAVILPVPYTTLSGIERAELRIKRDGVVVARLPLGKFRPVPVRDLGPVSSGAPLVISQSLRGLPVAIELAQDIDYDVRLKKPLPFGQLCFVRLVSMDCGPATLDDEWVNVGNSGAQISPHCGTLPKHAKLQVIFTTQQKTEKTIVAPLGQIVVQFGQPIFMVKSPVTIPLTPTASILLQRQGSNLLRPPSHPNRMIQILFPSTIEDGILGHELYDSAGKLYDSVGKIDWLSPNPAELGLDSIWTPWQKLSASGHSNGPVKTGALKATLRAHLIELQPFRTLTVIVPILRNASHT